MLKIPRIARMAAPLAVLALALLVAACARSPSGDLGGLGGVSGANGVASVTPGSPQDFVVNVGDRVFFETDSSQLSAQAHATLDKQAMWLNEHPRYTVVIEGHADERGTREYNLALGARRAAMVRDYLVSRSVATNRIRTISYGKERPVATCNDESCWAQNRRAVTVLDNVGM